MPSCPCPRPVQMRRPRGPIGQTGCGPWGAAATPQDSHGHRLTTGCGPSLDPVLMSPDRAQEASHPDMRSQLFLFLPGLILCSRGWDPGSHSESALDSLAPNRTQNFIFPVPSRNEFTSHLGSFHKLLQSTYYVPGIGATQQKYTHDLG